MKIYFQKTKVTGSSDKSIHLFLIFFMKNNCLKRYDWTGSSVVSFQAIVPRKENKLFDFEKVQCDIPQGFVVGPFLFALYIC